MKFLILLYLFRISLTSWVSLIKSLRAEVEV